MVDLIIQGSLNTRSAGEIVTNPVALIIEDHQEMAEIFSLTLQRAHYKTYIAEDGQQALEQLTQITPLLIILDLHLPYVSGIEILQHIRQHVNLMHTWVIIATADARKAKFIEQQEDTYSMVLLKPVSPTLLHELATRIYKHHTLIQL